MAVKISSFITITNPKDRGDTFEQCYKSAEAFSDEIIIIDGKDTWAKEFHWKTIGEHFQKGYEQANGDWVIHLDTDFIFHESDAVKIKEVLNKLNYAPACSFYKWQFILPDRYNLKSRLVLAVNKKAFGSRIRFDSGGDLCQPSLDGEYININQIPESGIRFFNYEKIIKTKKQIYDDIGRMERAYKRHFGHFQISKTGEDEEAYRCWVKLMVGRYRKPQREILLKEHPAVMIDTIKGLTKNSWGYSGFNNLGENNYVKGC